MIEVQPRLSDTGFEHGSTEQPSVPSLVRLLLLCGLLSLLSHDMTAAPTSYHVYEVPLERGVPPQLLKWDDDAIILFSSVEHNLELLSIDRFGSVVSRQASQLDLVPLAAQVLANDEILLLGHGESPATSHLAAIAFLEPPSPRISYAFLGCPESADLARLTSAVTTSSDGMLLVGTNACEASSTADLWLVELSSSEAVEKEMSIKLTWDAAPVAVATPYLFQRIPTGYLIVASLVPEFGSQSLLLVTLDAAGAPLAATHWPDWAGAISATQLADGSLLLDLHSGVLVHVSQDADYLSNRVYGRTGQLTASHPETLFVRYGHMATGPMDSDMILGIFHDLADPTYLKRFGELAATFTEEATGVGRRADGSFVLIGHRDESSLVVANVGEELDEQTPCDISEAVTATITVRAPPPVPVDLDWASRPTMYFDVRWRQETLQDVQLDASFYCQSPIACPEDTSVVKRVKMAKRGTEIDARWSQDPAAHSYNVWSVSEKRDIELARIGEPSAAGVWACSHPNSATTESCRITENWLTTLTLLQVRSYCDNEQEGP